MAEYPPSVHSDLSLIHILPGFSKDEIKVSLEDGYLTISAAKSHDGKDDEKEGKYIRRERFSGCLLYTSRCV